MLTAPILWEVISVPAGNHLQEMEKYVKVRTGVHYLELVTPCANTHLLTLLCVDIVEQGLSKEEKQEVVDEHNRLRQLVASGGQEGLPPASNMANLVYDEDLAVVAQRHADQCKFAHDSNRQTDDFSYVGQNLHEGSYPTVENSKTWASIVRGWYGEVHKFIDNGGNVDHFGGVKGVGHFTQVIWGTTTHIGCGRTKYRNTGKYNMLSVCNYGHGGNIKPKPIYVRA